MAEADARRVTWDGKGRSCYEKENEKRSGLDSNGDCDSSVDSWVRAGDAGK